ncbi:sensor histidine kinase [Nonomuraea lactucae]|uniref:sensor histidine kinase n=1 Tax=Nonomuraea lactucae TaxID=2249762 RepID=UPI0013B41D15|nr:histidine kinase [Nonomuraea lactucae]
MTDAAHPVNPLVASAAICRAVMLGRAAVVLTAAGAGLLVVQERWRVPAVLAVTVCATAAEVAALTRRPSVVRRAVAVMAVDSLVAVAVLLLSGRGIAFFCFTAGSAALGGALLGMRAWPIWTVQTALGFAVAAWTVRSGLPPSPDLAAFIMAFPMMTLLAGLGGAVATSALVRYVDLVVEVIASAQRSAAADERARLARELHDSVTKTLRGVSFAALALPSSLRRQPALAEQLADTVSRGAEAAAKEARQLLEGLRGDVPNQEFEETVRRVCEDWSLETRITVDLRADCPDPGVAVRYEMVRVLQEALSNVQRHSSAGQVRVRLRGTGGWLELVVADDGFGFRVPRDLTTLQAAGHFGLVGMAERATAVSGTLRVVSDAGGTVVTLRVPITGEAGVGGARARHQRATPDRRTMDVPRELTRREDREDRDTPPYQRMER